MNICHFHIKMNIRKKPLFFWCFFLHHQISRRDVQLRVGTRFTTGGNQMLNYFPNFASRSTTLNQSAAVVSA